MKRIAFPLTILCCALGASRLGQAAILEPSPSVAPFSIVDTGGAPRPVVQARLNGHPLPMMVHSAAGFYAQIDHAQAEAFGIPLFGGGRSMGIDRPGHVSDLGLNIGLVSDLEVGRTDSKDRNVAVFETPDHHQGMLGTNWIRSNRVIIDYLHRQVVIAPSPTVARRRPGQLQKRGYVGLAMSYDKKDNIFTVPVTISGVTRRMTVGSASGLLFDSQFIQAAGVESETLDNQTGNGPTGNKVPVYDLKSPIRIRIGEWASHPLRAAQTEDLYAYNAQPRPSAPDLMSGGLLGSPFLLEHKAIVDFGSGVLYLPKG